MANQQIKPIMLLILDGFGVAPPSNSNAVSLGKKPVLDYFIANYPTLTLQASGEAVGLSWGEMGNSEVCHLNLGSGQIIYQTLPKINKSIEDGTIKKNDKLLKAIDHAKKNKSKLHLMGLVSNGGVHSHHDHLYALLEMCKERGAGEVYIHAFLDGRDTAKDGAKEFIKSLQAKLTEMKFGQIASLSGRYYAMDRDNNWEREEKAYRAIALGDSPAKFDDPVKAIETSYGNQVFDEEFIPAVITRGGKPVATVNDNDAMIFFNFRADRARQLAAVFAVPGFDKFAKPAVKNFQLTTFTEYEKDLPVDVAYPDEDIQLPLAKLFSNLKLKQLHAAETEKYAHVTFFFNGRKEDPFEGEDRILVPSPAVSSYDQKPEMSVNELTAKLLKAIKTNQHHLYIVNFANPDMVGHTGVIPAAVKAVQAVDKAIGQLWDAMSQVGGTLMITADHGNCDEMINLQTGEVSKEHSTNPVPFIVVGEQWKGKSLVSGLDSANGDLSVLTPSGILADISPTILKLLEIDQPSDMTGSPLV
ncbi:MAG: 2,3-bisphosphoglycerate-independent phosphoglycerate mutase [Patescibacteria group bacterium]|jgi:2,3-bisphosphoglycerate-independent phosphoglycerate mutase|nr:2,3-bisphosphoglycerate-independent phosphoglycerate mutase [Patescibacteria group bacterium]